MCLQLVISTWLRACYPSGGVSPISRLLTTLESFQHFNFLLDIIPTYIPVPILSNWLVWLPLRYIYNADHVVHAEHDMAWWFACIFVGLVPLHQVFWWSSNNLSLLGNVILHPNYCVTCFWMIFWRHWCLQRLEESVEQHFILGDEIVNECFSEKLNLIFSLIQPWCSFSFDLITPYIHPKNLYWLHQCRHRHCGVLHSTCHMYLCTSMNVTCRAPTVSELNLILVAPPSSSLSVSSSASFSASAGLRGFECLKSSYMLSFLMILSSISPMKCTLLLLYLKSSAWHFLWGLSACLCK